MPRRTWRGSAGPPSHTLRTYRATNGQNGVNGGGVQGTSPAPLKRFLRMNSFVYIFTNKSIWLSDGRIFRTNIIILMLITKNRVIVILNTFHQSSYCLSYVIGWCCFTSYQTINFYVKKSCIFILI